MKTLQYLTSNVLFSRETRYSLFIEEWKISIEKENQQTKHKTAKKQIAIQNQT